jgi:DNA-binding MarR family transcriptional regulator
MPGILLVKRPDPRLDHMPGHLLRRCQQRAVDLFAAELGEDGPTPRQFALLLCIQQNPGATQIELVRQSGIDRSTLAEMLRRLLERGLVARQRTDGDKRANALRLTAAGEAMLARAAPAVVAVQGRILAPIPRGQRKMLIALLRRIADLPVDATGE